MGAEFPRRAARAHQGGERAGRAVGQTRARARAASIGLGLPAHVATCVAQRSGGSLPSRLPLSLAAAAAFDRWDFFSFPARRPLRSGEVEHGCESPVHGSTCTCMYAHTACRVLACFVRGVIACNHWLESHSLRQWLGRPHVASVEDAAALRS